MNQISRAIAALTFQAAGDNITRVLDPRVPHEVTYFIEGNEAEYYAALNQAGTKPADETSQPAWRTGPTHASRFISTMGNNRAYAGAWGESGIRSAYLAEYNGVILDKALRDLGQALEVHAAGQLGATPVTPATRQDTPLGKAVEQFVLVCEQTAELMTGEAFGSAEDFLRAFYRPHQNIGISTSGITQRQAAEGVLVQNTYTLYGWIKMIPADASIEEVAIHLKGFETRNAWGNMSMPGYLPGFDRLGHPTSWR